jgi:hypothetical protein
VTKRENIDDLNSCWNKAKDEEFVFVLLGRDKAVPTTIRMWAFTRVAMGLNKRTDEQIVRAYQEADEIERQHGP